MFFIFSSVFVALSGFVAGWFLDSLTRKIVLQVPCEEQHITLTAIPHWIIPVINALVYAATWWQEPYRAAPLYLFGSNLVIMWLLLLIAIVDLQTHFIFPRMLAALALLAAGILILSGLFDLTVGLVKSGSESWQAVRGEREGVSNPGFVQLWSLNIWDSFLGTLLMVLYFGLFWGTGRFIFRREVMGTGDVALAAVIGFCLGLKRSAWSIPVILILSFLVALSQLTVRRFKGDKVVVGNYMAFGPYLCGGAILALMYVY